MSLGASGKLAKTIVFSHWKGRPYVRQLVTPSNPRSRSQTGRRAMLSFLSKAWHRGDLSPTDEATWATLAKQLIVSNFNAFTKTNLANWTQFLYPFYHPTSLRAGTPAVLAAPTVTGGVGEINWSQVVTTENTGWGIALFFSTTPAFTASIADLRLVIPIHGIGNGGTALGTILHLPHGSNWYYRYTNFTLDGASAAISAAAGPIAVT
jgi:hypothetical protein